MNAVPVTILLIEDDPGHARLIEKNVRRAGVNNEIILLADGTSAMAHLFGRDAQGFRTIGQALLVLLDLGCNVYITKPVDYEGFATAIRQLGLFLSVMQVPETV
jgi:DNA-binding response OmpR family regulator